MYEKYFKGQPESELAPISIVHPSYMNNNECPEKIRKIVERYNDIEFLIALFTPFRDEIGRISEQIGFGDNVTYLLGNVKNAPENNSKFKQAWDYFDQKILKLVE